mmetsp:Transcript_76256/g.220214  ORF Transcript_76256/g.220214 Transcript_76256/m.220214 type:complete len:288 (+) Transcript_76256:244-1107(+)
MMLMISPLFSSLFRSRSHSAISCCAWSAPRPPATSSLTVSVPSPSASSTSNSASTSSRVRSNFTPSALGSNSEFVSALSFRLVSSCKMWKAWNCRAHLKQAEMSFGGTVGHTKEARQRNEMPWPSSYCLILETKSGLSRCSFNFSMSFTRSSFMHSTPLEAMSKSNASSKPSRTRSRLPKNDPKCSQGIVLFLASLVNNAHSMNALGFVITAGSFHGRSRFGLPPTVTTGSGESMSLDFISVSTFESCCFRERSRESSRPEKWTKDSKTLVSVTGNLDNKARVPLLR